MQRLANSDCSHSKNCGCCQEMSERDGNCNLNPIESVGPHAVYLPINPISGQGWTWYSVSPWWRSLKKCSRSCWTWTWSSETITRGGGAWPCRRRTLALSMISAIKNVSRCCRQMINMHVIYLTIGGLQKIIIKEPENNGAAIFYTHQLFFLLVSYSARSRGTALKLNGKYSVIVKLHVCAL